MHEPLSLRLFYPFLGLRLGKGKQLNQFGNWKGSCAVCGTMKTGTKGLFCSTFGICDGRPFECQSVWCGSCYVAHPNDNFHINLPTYHLGFAWETEQDKTRFNVAHDGDHLICAFQCDTCLFYMLTQRFPHPQVLKDNTLLCCIRRANLKSVRILKEVGIEPKYQPLGPYSLKDVQGVSVAITMLLESLDPGMHALYTQYETIRKLRAAYSNAFMASVEAQISTFTLGRATAKVFF